MSSTYNKIFNRRMKMQAFNIIVRTAARDYFYKAIAATAGLAGEEAAELFDEPCGITVMPAASAK
jgi:hypothetical protein